MSDGPRARPALAATLVTALLTALLVALPTGCGDAARPLWLDLARYEASLAPPLGAVGPGVRVEREGEDLWLVGEIARAAWSGGTERGRFTAPLPVYHVGSPSAGGAVYRLRAGDREFPFERDPAAFGREPGRFTTELTKAKLALAPGEEPPERAEVWASLAFESLSGEGPAAERRLGGRRISGSGLWVPSGHARELALSIPPDSRLRFGTALEALLGAREARTAPRTFRVLLDGVVLFERELAVDVLGEALEWHAVDLPRGGVRRANLRFEVEGPLALSSFLAPRIGPRETGRYGARPAGLAGAGRDLVVFLADTFRADNLGAYGGTLGLTPEIDRFAAEARVFAQAWSVSTHTLPAHSSMFSGVYPHQNGQVDYYNPLPGAVETLAERLTAHGYRCGLVSDGVMVSQSHGLDQGFESFDERRELDTLARVQAFLDADDGRPIFLFVQTYHAHTPYVVREETVARWRDVLRLDQSFDEVMRAPVIRALEHAWPVVEAPPTAEADREPVQRLFDLYRAKASELDGLFARFRAELEARGLFEEAVLVFTSDHGEAFFEHGRPFHAGRVYEEELRVPLIVHGPPFEPGRDERPVSLIDFAPTLAELAGLPRPAHWRGRSLLTPQEERVLYAFQARERDRPTLAVIDGARKVIGYESKEAVARGELHAAFDLAADPAEQASVHETETWPAELLRSHGAALDEMLTPLVTPELLDPTPDQLRALEAMGYTGGADDEEDEQDRPR